ncbi:MAG: hypothetical protein K0B14_14445 [Anaerolineaceae bacterium]|nr:hypothetical protein [Anaerolineaceae bacterium]
METYTIPMAIFDFLPNIAFLVGAFFLVKIAVLVRGRPCSRMVMAGALLVALGGILKATWKFLYAANIADIHLFSELQFILLAPGFFGLLIAVIYLARNQAKNSHFAAFAIAPWKLPLLFVMTITSLGAYGILTYLSFRGKVPMAAIGFIFAFVGVLLMGGLASQPQTVSLQWIEQSINTLANFGFAMGCILLYQNYRLKAC